MMSLLEIEGRRGADLQKVIDDARILAPECDGIVILMQRKSGGMVWLAPDTMRLETLIFYCWQALALFGLMTVGKP